MTRRQSAQKIYLVHAGHVSMPAAHASFAALWPEAPILDLMEGSLAHDVGQDGGLTPAMFRRFELLGDYCVAAGATAILFTCSAFGEAIERVKRQHAIPVLTPNEALFDEILLRRDRVALLSTFEPTVTALRQELGQMELAAGQRADIDYFVIPRALDVLFAGDKVTHDRLVLEKVDEVAGLGYGAIAFGQFTLSMVAPAARERTTLPILTTPDCAVRKLRNILEGPANSAAR
ncbi:MAG: arylsulfatase [Aquimonas sp.]|nr:arylsulfatase [Aquimonas sp.]